MKKREAGFTLIELLIVIAIIGILAAIAIPNLLNAVQRGKQKRTMADMRSMATAIESYSVDNNSYPTAACPANAFTAVGTAIDTASFTLIVPTYIAQLVVNDGWGKALNYKVDPTAGDQYNLLSFGKDKVVSTPVCGTTTNFNDDIIFSNGQFVQWPEGTQN